MSAQFTESARQWAEHTLPDLIDRQWQRIPQHVRDTFWLAAWMAVSGTAALLVLRGVA